MEESIHFTNSHFDFSKLSLAKPQQIPGGSYFMKLCLANSQNPFYFRLPECTIKQGFLKSGKKYYTDLMFTNANSDFIEFMENLESKCMKLIFENSEQWFEDKMEMHDIEDYFTAPLKIYRSGKYYNLRINIGTNLGKPLLKIYDEEENLVPLENIKEKTKVLSIIEIKGIKCSNTTFQLEFEAKQMMIVQPNKLFEKCLFKPTINESETKPIESHLPVSEPSTTENNNTIESFQNEEIETTDEPIHDVVNEEDENILSSEVIESDIVVNTDDNNLEEIAEDTSLEKEEEDTNMNLENTNDEIGKIEVNHEETLEKLEEEEKDELEEVHLTLDKINEDESFTIKNKNSVYYDMYREAKRKAKVARDLALSSYLEAKRIKNLYMLEDTSDSDSESDTESNAEDENIE